MVLLPNMMNLTPWGPGFQKNQCREFRESAIEDTESGSRKSEKGRFPEECHFFKFLRISLKNCSN